MRSIALERMMFAGFVLGMAVSLAAAEEHAPARVEVVKSRDGSQLLREGRPYVN